MAHMAVKQAAWHIYSGAVEDDMLVAVVAAQHTVVQLHGGGINAARCAHMSGG